MKMQNRFYGTSAAKGYQGSNQWLTAASMIVTSVGLGAYCLNKTSTRTFADAATPPAAFSPEEFRAFKVCSSFEEIQRRIET